MIWFDLNKAILQYYHIILGDWSMQTINFSNCALSVSIFNDWWALSLAEIVQSSLDNLPKEFNTILSISYHTLPLLRSEILRDLECLYCLYIVCLLSKLQQFHSDHYLSLSCLISESYNQYKSIFQLWTSYRIWNGTLLLGLRGSEYSLLSWMFMDLKYSFTSNFSELSLVKSNFL